jgi:hypothetical protein
MTRTILLFVPSTLIVLSLVLHSLKVRGRRETLLFFLSALLFGILRGNIIWWITTVHFGGRFPYVFTNQLVGFFHDALQADIGWILTLYVGYATAEWMTRRWPGRETSLFHILSLSGLFAVCLSYAVETAAMTMGWWNWNLSTKSRFFMDVPMAGIAAWFSVPIDFLTPYCLLVRGSRRLRPWGIAALGIFPLHMLVHLSNRRLGALLPLTPFNLFYWLVAMGVLALPFLVRVPLTPDRRAPGSGRSSARPAGPASAGPAAGPAAGAPAGPRSLLSLPARSSRLHGIHWVIPGAVAAVIAVLLVADLGLAGKPGLLVSVLPLISYILVAYLPASAPFLLGAAALGSLIGGRPVLFALVPGLLVLLFTLEVRWPRLGLRLAAGLGIPLILTSFFYHDAVDRDSGDRLYGQLCQTASTLARKGDLDGAARAYQRATALRPESVRAWEELGLLQVHRKDYARAEEAYLQVLRKLPISPEIWNSLGNVYLMRGERARALESYRRALRYDPGYEPARKMIDQVTGSPPDSSRGIP